MTQFQNDFDLTIGQLDRVLSKLVGWGRLAKLRRENDRLPASRSIELEGLDEPNQQTLKHHAEDMIAAGQKILKDLGKSVEGTPQP
jgi:hypothetical protein